MAHVEFDYEVPHAKVPFQVRIGKEKRVISFLLYSQIAESEYLFLGKQSGAQSYLICKVNTEKEKILTMEAHTSLGEAHLHFKEKITKQEVAS